LRAGQTDLAYKYLRHALTIDPKLPLALNTLGVVQAQRGDYDAAIESWSRAVELDRNLLDALFNLGLVAAKVQRTDVAQKAFRAYLDRAPHARFAKERARAEQILRGLS
jgi:lipoprotein NlpI